MTHPLVEQLHFSAALRSSFERLLATPTAEELWRFQKELLLLAGADVAPARRVARVFHSCLRTLESKSASRSASRWGAVLGTAAVASVSLPEVRDRQERSLGELLERALPAVLEIGAALRSAEAWEIEASLIYDEFAWFLYEELWDVSIGARPELSADERRRAIDEVLDPLLDPRLPDADRATLVVEVFRSVLAARVLPLLG
jgi:AcrR family transcriptional regulator